ncbi:hypothetical protein M406DRAFT_91336 [Cryphonectria parasitica EP155]|uniref:Uncharacterized protein n=1 Tax=Cryphonectria parasitica (strain ATCC 38755 / EP155) TaxID=660469 RepID=A0A9P4Y190_CRYP1|nr:uncharacterized protein M406DRAFT_91336 [Cryphonectria parasitica EP155]KAF3764633.1 hypothetical protein M406DRAFT_91336 [Cryphonectria parasitica EP155]
MQEALKRWNPERNWSYKPFNRKWRKRAPMFWIMPFELAGTVCLLVLFAIAQPDLFRTQLWEVGYVWGFNSNPDIILLAEANHKPHPNVPFVWSLNLTDYNVGISVLSLFVLLAKLVGFIMRVWTPILGVFFSLSLSVMYTVSVYGQMGPDYYDPAHPSPIAWYIRYGCWPAVNFPNNAVGSCHMAVGTYSVTVYLLFIYLLCLGYAVYNMIPTAEEKEEIKTRKAMKADDASSGGRMTPVDKVMFEMYPPPPQQHQQTAFTPRTQAFQTLERKLPLRGD